MVVLVLLVEPSAVVSIISFMLKSADIVALPLESKRMFNGIVVCIVNLSLLPNVRPDSFVRTSPTWFAPMFAVSYPASPLV